MRAGISVLFRAVGPTIAAWGSDNKVDWTPGPSVTDTTHPGPIDPSARVWPGRFVVPEAALLTAMAADGFLTSA